MVVEVEEALCRGGRTPNGCSSVRQVVLTLKCPVTHLPPADHCWLEGTLRLLLGLTQKYCPNVSELVDQLIVWMTQHRM